MKRIVCFVLLIAMLLCGCGAHPKSSDQASFSHWNADAPALNALIEYVRAVTDKASPDFIPPEDRIATFDMDGTLIGELFPTYLEDVMLMHRIFDDPTYTPDEDMLAFGLVIRDHAVDRTFPAGFEYEFSSHLAKAFAGMTLEEYDEYVTKFLATPVDGFEDMTYAKGYYLPMAEVIAYLLKNDFKCYIVSGSDRFTIRTFIKGAFDIPSENCIGSDAKLEAKDQGGAEDYDYQFTEKDTLVRTEQLLVKDVKTSKVQQIAREIGKQPVLSFGNSSGDVSMHNYALYHNRYKSAAFQLIADDDVQDYGHPEKGPELRRQWEDMGFHVISMHDDWKTIYGENVLRTGEIHWYEDYADDKISEKMSGMADFLSAA